MSVLLELDVSKGAGPDGIPLLILKNCVSAFARQLSLLFNRSETYLRDTDIQERQAILSAIPKRFELLVYRTMYDDLKKLIHVNKHGFMKKRSTVTNLLEYASFVLTSIEEGWLLIEFAINCYWQRIQRIRNGDAVVPKDIRVTSGVPHQSHLVFYLVCKQNIGDFRLCLCAVLRQ
jgi:hypothetical protein